MIKYLLLILFFLPLGADNLEEALMNYRQGELASNSREAQTAFNSALENYHALAVTHTSAKLYANIANCYFQLAEYPWAILYYERALALQPRSNAIRDSLNSALERLGAKMDQTSLLQQLMLANFFSQKERVIATALLGFILLVVGSLALWTAIKWLYRLSIVLAAATIILLATIFILEYLGSHNGVLVRASMVRCDAGDHYAPVTDKPLRAGSNITVKKINDDWAYITAPNARGYIPTTNLRLL